MQALLSKATEVHSSLEDLAVWSLQFSWRLGCLKLTVPQDIQWAEAYSCPEDMEVWSLQFHRKLGGLKPANSPEDLSVWSLQSPRRHGSLKLTVPQETWSEACKFLRLACLKPTVPKNTWLSEAYSPQPKMTCLSEAYNSPEDLPVWSLQFHRKLGGLKFANSPEDLPIWSLQFPRRLGCLKLMVSQRLGRIKLTNVTTN